MLKTIFQSFRSKRTANSRSGFVYVSDEDQGPMRDAREGSEISTIGRGPPWIVVNHDMASVIPARWPGKLWRVDVVDAATAAEQGPSGGPPLASARYTRAVAVKIIGEEDIGQLFGLQGGTVLRVIDAASNLDKSQAESLASNRDPKASAACDRAWRAWMRTQGISDTEYPEPLGNALLLGTSGSPINRGLTVLHDVTFRRAKELQGDAAVIVDDEDVWLAEPWNTACAALGDAALALGAPEFVDRDDSLILKRGWAAVYGYRRVPTSHS
jgi:hypothetical protein